ncbi:hypothetical protein D3C75_900930 [compost metagenome]
MMAVITVVLPVPGGPWITAISGVFKAMRIASSCTLVGGLRKTLSRTKGVNAAIFLGSTGRGGRPFSSMIMPRYGIPPVPCRTFSRASSRRSIWVSSPPSESTTNRPDCWVGACCKVMPCSVTSSTFKVAPCSTTCSASGSRRSRCCCSRLATSARYASQSMFGSSRYTGS